jgi:hypothetical protein
MTNRAGNSIRTKARDILVLGFSLLSCMLIVGVSGASASLPTYDGSTDFPEIYGPSEPEEFSWEVKLGKEQELRAIDEREAAVFYNDGTRAFVIEAGPAHDADGATVPTTIQVSGENVITLIVHHREGNPAAGGAPFVYPVNYGEGWEGGFSTVVVKGPPDEQELREERERQERASRERQEEEQQPAAGQAKQCQVPRLRGVTLAGARRRLRRADCDLGSITRARGVRAKAGRVIGQTEAPGSSLEPHARIGVRFGTAL